MSSIQDADLKLQDAEKTLKQSALLKSLIHDQVVEESRKNEERRATVAEKDPYGVADAIEAKHGAFDAKTFKTEDGKESRNYDQLLDMSHRIRDWLDCGGEFFSDKAQRVVKMSFGDAVHSKDMHMLFPKVVSNIVLEHSEPQSNILGLYEKIRFSNGTQIQFPVWSPGGQSINYYLPETGEPNELTGDFSSFLTASTGKVGIKASITEDTMRFSIIDLYRLQLRWCGEALGRFKEKLAVDNLFSTASANVLFDNSSVAGEVNNGFTSGRNQHGALNGTLSSGDIYDAYAHGMAQGSDLRVLVIHPLGWRALSNVNAISSQDRPMPIAQGAQIRGATGGAGLGKVFNPGHNTAEVGLDKWATQASAMVGVANIFGRPFQILTTPYAPIRKATTVTSGGGAGLTTTVNNAYVCDILMLDPRDVGIHVVDQDLYSREESKFFDQIRETAFFERYGFGSSNKGHGLFMLKNVSAIAGYDFDSQPISRQISALDDTITGGNIVNIT